MAEVSEQVVQLKFNQNEIIIWYRFKMFKRNKHTTELSVRTKQTLDVIDLINNNYYYYALKELLRKVFK